MENEDKFICPFPGCSRVFQKRWSLTRHCRKHTGEKPFRCSKCNKEFVEKCGLVRHEQTHTDERHWECDVLGCKKKFKLKEYLDIHKKTWHAKNDVNVNNDFTLRSLTETSGANDTTDQLRQRLVRMSLRHREVIYAQQQRESELLSKLRACSHYLQNSLTMITFDTQEKKAFKTNVSKFLNETIALGSEDTDSSDSHDDIMISNGQQLPLPLPQLPHSQPQQHQQQYLNSHQIVPNENLLPLNHNNLINRADLSIAEYLAHQLGDNNQIYCSEDPNKFLDYQSQNHNHQQPQQQTQQQQQYALEFYSNTSSTNDLLGDHNNFFEVLSPESKRHGDWDDSNLYHLRKKQHFDNNENLDQYQTHNNSILSHSNSLPLPTQLTTSISSSSSNCPFNDFTTMLESTSSILTNDNNHQNQNYNHNYNHNLYSDSFHPISSLSISSHNTNFHNNNNHHHNHNHNHNQVSSSCESPTDSIGYSSAKQYSVSNPSSPTTSVSSQQSSLYSKLSSGIPPSLTIPQTCSISNGPLACLPNSANGILDVMFTLSSEVTPSTSVNGITSSQSQHMYSNHIPLNSYPGLSISSSSLSIPTSVLSQSNTLLSSSSSSLSPLLSSKSTSSSSMLLNSGQSINSTISTNDNMATASSSSSHSTNIADVMAWIKNNPLKTTKRYN